MHILTQLVEVKWINHQQSSITIAMTLDSWERKDVISNSACDKELIGVLINVTVKLVKQKLKVHACY